MRAVTLLLLLFPLLARAEIYTLGSSYTWDAIPDDLDDSPEWHIDCAKALVYIYENPWSPCKGSSNPWPTALAATAFDAISFQNCVTTGFLA